MNREVRSESTYSWPSFEKGTRKHTIWEKTTFSINDGWNAASHYAEEYEDCYFMYKSKVKWANDITVISEIVKLVEEHTKGKNFTKFFWVLGVVSKTIDISNTDKRDPPHQGNNLQNKETTHRAGAHTREP